MSYWIYVTTSRIHTFIIYTMTILFGELSFIRKGTMDMPLMILFSKLIGESGIVFAKPVSEGIYLAARIFVIAFVRHQSGT